MFVPLRAARPNWPGGRGTELCLQWPTPQGEGGGDGLTVGLSGHWVGSNAHKPHTLEAPKYNLITNYGVDW